MQDQDKDLLDQLKSGDRAAYEIFFKTYYRTLISQAFYVLGDDMEAEDLVQNVFVDFWQQKRYNFINTSLKAYLQRTVYNSCLNAIAKRKSVTKKLQAYGAEWQAFLEAGVADEEDKNERFAHSILKTLPVQQGQAFNLVYLEDKKYKDAAREMGISINSIKTHLKLAVRSLRERVNKK